MKITSIKVQEKNKERCSVFLDGDFSFSLSIEEVYLYRLKVGEELTEIEVERIKIESENKDCFNKSLNYVSRYMKTGKQVKEYLLSKGYSDDAVKYAVDKLKEYNFINDEEFVKRYFESRSVSEGDRLSQYKLMNKGIRKETIEKVKEGNKNNSVERAKAVVDKRLKNKEITKELINKTYRYLISRGFSYEDSQNAVSCYIKDAED